jgi:hypothetical protein
MIELSDFMNGDQIMKRERLIDETMISTKVVFKMFCCGLIVLLYF